METEVVVAIITSVTAIILSVITLMGRRADKRDERKKREADAKKQERATEFEKIKEASSAHIKEIADEITAQYQKRVDALEKEVCILKQKVHDLEEELKAAYNEIKRLRGTPKNRQQQAKTESGG